MNSAIIFVELENRVISATYRNLMIKARVVPVNMARGEQLADPVITISSPMPSGALAAGSRIQSARESTF